MATAAHPLTDGDAPRVALAEPAGAADQAERVERILEVFAQEARIDRALLRLDARADELGIESLDMTLALFELEERFGVRIDEPPPGVPLPTVGDIVRQVLARMAPAAAAPQGG